MKFLENGKKIGVKVHLIVQKLNFIVEHISDQPKSANGHFVKFKLVCLIKVPKVFNAEVSFEFCSLSSPTFEINIQTCLETSLSTLKTRRALNNLAQ